MRRQTGFSLIEMAVVMVIVGALLGGLLVSLGSTRVINQRSDTESEIEEIMEALYGFAQVNGRLPCPASAASNGDEDVVGAGPGGACTQRRGFVPSVALGMSGAVNADGLLLDPWGNPYRYIVTNSNGSAFTTPAGMRATGMAALAPSLQVCGEAACTNVLAAAVPAVVLSMGADWAEFTGADVDATENAEGTTAGYRHSNDDNFVLSGYIEDVYDDIVEWMSPTLLYTRMISANQLP